MKYLLLLFIISSCSVNKNIQSDKDNYLILNDYLKNKKGVVLIKENYFSGSTSKYFAMYKKWHQAEINTKEKLGILFNGKVEWILSKDDLKYMTDNYTEWKVGVWNKDKITSDVELIDPESYKGHSMVPNIKISYPFFNKNKTKAMVVISKANNSLNGGVHMLLFKKSNPNKWEQVGKLLVSIS